jgi:hypothetical protein
MIERAFTPCHIAPMTMLLEDLEGGTSGPTYVFAPHSVPDGLPKVDVAQRLIDLETEGRADELTWASY